MKNFYFLLDDINNNIDQDINNNKSNNIYRKKLHDNNIKKE